MWFCCFINNIENTKLQIHAAASHAAIIRAFLVLHHLRRGARGERFSSLLWFYIHYLNIKLTNMALYINARLNTIQIFYYVTYKMCGYINDLFQFCVNVHVCIFGLWYFYSSCNYFHKYISGKARCKVTFEWNE